MASSAQIRIAKRRRIDVSPSISQTRSARPRADGPRALAAEEPLHREAPGRGEIRDALAVHDLRGELRDRFTDAPDSIPAHRFTGRGAPRRVQVS
jgi:hypothetical protein